jgi:glycolate oxidase iron-sulfur subunit
MQTKLADFIRNTPEGEEADAILRACVHCGFCTATCPTYQLLGDELDGPRGRIYLMKQVLEGKEPTERTQLHLDRCLTCRNCETTCPSGVQYGRLVEIGRKVVEDRVERPLRERIVRTVLKEGVTRQWLFKPALRTGQALRSLLPHALKNKVPTRQDAGRWPKARHARKMLMLAGCVQPGMAPNINNATARVFDKLGIQAVVAKKEGCCGAIRYHMNDHEGGLADMRRNIDAWWPHVESGADAIVMNASGCGAMVKEYGHLLRHDPDYAEKAKQVSELTRDLSELLPEFETDLLEKLKGRLKQEVVFHPPCSLQHGIKVRGKVEDFLRKAGMTVRIPDEVHLCCGSAGTYSVLHPEYAYQLRDRKLDKLQATKPEIILSANVGCITHLQSGTGIPVMHWIELVDRAIRD